jgi:hypothetical protein
MAEWQLVSPPKTWQELQEKVAMILEDCGYETEVEKEIDLGRGKAVIDVYAQRPGSLSSMVLCECKYWKKKVPRSIAREFRTIVLEAGANHGYIISEKGFQSGTYEAVERTNIALLSWLQFEQAFRMDWLKHWVDKITRAGVELRSFVDYLIRLSVGNDEAARFITSKWSEMEEIRTGHENWLFLSMKDHYTQINTSEVSWAETVTTIEKRAPQYLPSRPSYLREYFQPIYDRCLDEIKTIEALFEGRLQWDPEKMLPY